MRRWCLLSLEALPTAIFFRDLGITSYGYSPFAFTVAEFSGVHGNDERISVEKCSQRSEGLLPVID